MAQTWDLVVFVTDISARLVIKLNVPKQLLKQTGGAAVTKVFTSERPVSLQTKHSLLIVSLAKKKKTCIYKNCLWKGR